MTTRKHLLAPGFKFLEPADFEKKSAATPFRSGPDWQKIEAGELCILAHEGEDQMLLLPPVMKHFLQAFAQPTTIEEVTGFFAREAGCRPEEIGPTMGRFFGEMTGRGILLRETVLRRAEKAAAENQKKAWKPGQLVNGFELLEKLSGKQDLAVWKARRAATGETVVLKACFASQKLPEKRRAQRFERFGQEFALLAELQGHPGVCRFFGLEAHENGQLAVLEFIEGRSPRRWLDDEKPPLAAKLAVIEQLFGAIGHLHGCGILQGDIHGANFLIENGGRVRLIDFDLANHAEPHDGEIVHEGGVFEYIPPEKITANVFEIVHDRADFRSEVWQVGLVAYSILYEKPAFEAFSWQVLAERILTEAPDFQPVTPLGEPVPARILACIKKTLEKNPAGRFADGQTLSSEFQLNAD